VISLLCTLGKLSCKPTSTSGEHTLGELPRKSPITLGEHTLGELSGKQTGIWVNIHWVNCLVNSLLQWVNIHWVNCMVNHLVH
jgi:hypothetical protein